MAIRTIVTTPDPVLRRKAHKVTVFDKDLQTLIDDMVETMRAAPGVGLAAPQVGVSQRVIVVEYGEDAADDEEETVELPKKLFTIVNPEIISASDEIEEGLEGCLSIPRIHGDVDRHLKLVVKGFNRQGKPVKLKLSGWIARIFQHEIDHLEGILFTDRATRAWRIKEDEEFIDTV